MAGIVDYLIFTMFISRPGWLIYSFLYIFISMKSKIILNIKSPKSFRSSLGNRSTSPMAALLDFKINHPGRNKPLHYFGYLCAAAPPLHSGSFAKTAHWAVSSRSAPFKRRGNLFQSQFFNTTLKLIAMGLREKAGRRKLLLVYINEELQLKYSQL